MDEYINEGADIFNEDKNKKQHILIKIFKWFAVCIIFVVCGLLFYRCVSSFDHKIVKKVLTDNEIFMEEYSKNPQEVEVFQYGMNSPWVAIRDGRLIEFNYFYHIPKTRQLQFSVKYNEDLPQIEYDSMPFRFTLVDEDGNEYTDYYFEEASRSRFRYIRLCFNNIDLLKEGYDEYGNKNRHNYTLLIDVISKNGKTDQQDEYTRLCEYLLYDGKNMTTTKKIQFELEK